MGDGAPPELVDLLHRAPYEGRNVTRGGLRDGEIAQTNKMLFVVRQLVNGLLEYGQGRGLRGLGFDVYQGLFGGERRVWNLRLAGYTIPLCSGELRPHQARRLLPAPLDSRPHLGEDLLCVRRGGALRQEETAPRLFLMPFPIDVFEHLLLQRRELPDALRQPAPPFFLPY